MSPSGDILPSRRRRRLGRWIGISLLVLTLGLSVGIAGPFIAAAQSPSPTGLGIHKVSGATWRPESSAVLFIAVLGSDARSGPPEAGGGCDAIHVIAINPTTKAGTILNFPRDSYLEGSKLTDTCRRSGFESAIRVLQNHTGLSIHYYARTEFSHFMSFIDELGGIDVNVPYAMSDSASGAFFQPGTRHMQGGDALAFTRNRKDTPRGDFSRTENQGILMIAALAKFRGDVMSDPHRLFDFIRSTQRHIRITVPLMEMIRLGLLAKDIDPSAIQNVTVPGSTGNVGSASVVFLSPGDTYDRVRGDGVY